MSIRIMSQIWEMPFAPTDKLVFLALADCANDEGLAWPSVATIARKSGVSERTVQRSIRLGEKEGFIRREEVTGKGCKYYFNPRQRVTTDKVSRVTNKAKTPDTVSPKPSRTTKSIIKRTHVDKPDCVSTEVWSDWLNQRKTVFSKTALEGFEREAANAGWSLERAITEAIERGWQGFKADWVKEKNNGTSNRQSNKSGKPQDGFVAALRHIADGSFDEPSRSVG